MLNNYIQKRVNRELENRGYTEAIILNQIRDAEGQTDAEVSATGAVQASASLLGRCFSMAEINPPLVSQIITPAVMYDVGYALMNEGEAVYAIDVVDGRATLTRAASWDIKDAGGSWRYKVTLASPTSTRTISLPADAVFHPRINTSASQPHKGRSPVEISGYTGNMAANLERSLADETAGSTGHVLPHPENLGEPNIEALKNDLAALKGKTALVASMSKGFGDGRSGAPNDWQPRRIGANPPESLIQLRGDVTKSMLAVCGVPPSIFDAGSNANASREGLRQFLHSTITPLGEIVALEAREKIHPEVNFSFERLNAADVQGRARGAKALVDAGFSLSEASKMTGFESGGD